MPSGQIGLRTLTGTQADVAISIENNEKISRLSVHYEDVCSADYTVTNSWGDVTGASVVVLDPGIYFVTATFDFHHSGAGGGVAQGALNVNGTRETPIATLDEGSVRGTCSQTWIITTTKKNITVKLQAQKSIGAGTVLAKQNNTSFCMKRIA